MIWKHQMAYHKQLFPDKRTKRDGNLAKYNADLDKYVSDRIQSAQTEFHEIEAFEVTEISKEVYGGVKGVFIDEDSQTVKGFGQNEDIVLCLKPNFTQIPLVGEHVAVIEFNNKHYYTDIINRQNSPNENALAGTSGYDELKKYGDTFQRDKSIKHIDINEGDIVFNSRFNGGIVLGSDDNKAVTKIVVGHKKVKNNLYSQNIDFDDSSIYLMSEGTATNLNGQRVEGKKVLIKSDDIFITGRNNIFLEADEVFINAKKVGTIKMGDPRAPMVPTIRGDVMLKFQSDILTLFSDIQQVLVLLIANPAVFVAKAKALVDKIVRLTEVITKQTFLNKQVMTANPDFKLPKLEIPDLDLPDVPNIKVPNLDLPDLDLPDVDLGISKEDLEDIT